MLKVLSKLVFILLITSNLFCQENKKLFFVGHAYGSQETNDENLDPVLINYIKESKNNYDKIIFGGDFIFDCKNQIEIDNFKTIYNDFKINLIIGNHETNCQTIKDLIISEKTSLNYYELFDDNLLLYLNTSIINDQEVDLLFKFIDKKITENNPENIIIFTHQLIYVKSNFYLKVNSRDYYKYSNILYDKIHKEYFGDSKKFFFVSGDIGAFKNYPFGFYHENNNFNFYASGIGNEKNYIGVSVDLKKEVELNFIDLETSLIEPKNKFKKNITQLKQLPFVLYIYIKSNFELIVLVILFLFFLIKKSKLFNTCNTQV